MLLNIFVVQDLYNSVSVQLSFVYYWFLDFLTQGFIAFLLYKFRERPEIETKPISKYLRGAE